MGINKKYFTIIATILLIVIILLICNYYLGNNSTFIKNLINGMGTTSEKGFNLYKQPEIEVPVDYKAEEREQKSVDQGHSPWKLDSIFVTQVFVSLKISPQGITGDYPIDYDRDLKIIQDTGRFAIIKVSSKKTAIKRVYLKKLIRQDETGIWTVVGYDIAD